MAIEVKLSFEDGNEPKTAEALLKAYNDAKEKAKFEGAIDALESKRSRIIDALNNSEDNKVSLNASLKKQVVKIVSSYNFTESEVNAEYKRLNPAARKKRVK